MKRWLARGLERVGNRALDLAWRLDPPVYVPGQLTNDLLAELKRRGELYSATFRDVSSDELSLASVELPSGEAR